MNFNPFCATYCMTQKKEPGRDGLLPGSLCACLVGESKVQ